MAYCFINASSHVQHSEAKQTEMSEIWSDKGLLQGHGGNWWFMPWKEKKNKNQNQLPGRVLAKHFFLKEKLIANETAGKGLISTIYKPLNTRKINNPMKNEQKT